MEERKQQQQRITQLPGEEGYHSRDGSLTKKKREQWEREKAEAEQNSWFPFGKKSLIAKRQKIQKRLEGEANQKENFGSNGQASIGADMDMEGNGQILICSGPGPEIGPAAAATVQQICQQQPMLASPPPFFPLFLEYPHQQQLFPLIPVQGAHQFGTFSPYPLLPVPFNGPTFLDPLFFPQKVPLLSVLPTPPFSGSSSSDSANSPPKQGSRGSVGPKDPSIQPMLPEQEMESAQIVVNSRWQEDLDQQKADRMVAERMEAERRREEERELERQVSEQARREEEQRGVEERRRSSKLEIREQHEQSCLEGILRAQREAELLKRAKLFRHILQDGETDLETAKEVLRTEDEGMIANILKQLRELELQRRIATESRSVVGKPSPKEAAASLSTPKAKGIVVAVKGDGPVDGRHSGGPFARANSWSVKQPSSIPNQSLLPTPIRLKQKQRKPGGGGREGGRRTDQHPDQAKNGPSNNGLANGGGPAIVPKAPSSPNLFLPPKAPAVKTKLARAEGKTSNKSEHDGLFGQLTLRRPRLASLGKGKERMALSDGAKLDLNGNADENDDGQIAGTEVDGNGNLASAPNPQKHTANCPAPSIGQANSPAVLPPPIQTSNVVKLRSILLGPEQSPHQESLQSEPAVLLPSPQTPTGPSHFRNSGFLAGPSPFSRKNAINEGNNKGDFGEQVMRRSLRSPTMRRLQDSLQSLATIDGSGDAEGEHRGQTPPFHCRNGQYRSFNMRRDTARQKQILEHLAAVRAQLKSSQAQLEKTISKQNLAGNEAEGTSLGGTFL